MFPSASALYKFSGSLRPQTSASLSESVFGGEGLGMRGSTSRRNKLPLRRSMRFKSPENVTEALPKAISLNSSNKPSETLAVKSHRMRLLYHICPSSPALLPRRAGGEGSQEICFGTCVWCWSVQLFVMDSLVVKLMQLRRFSLPFDQDPCDFV
jgi:hypothetical protein